MARPFHHSITWLLVALSDFFCFVLFVRLNEWMNEWMNECMCIYIPHISHTVSRRFTILIEWDRTSACKGASGCRYQSIFDLTHPPSPCMKCTMKQQIDHHTGNYAPYSFRQVCGFFNVPCWPCNTEDAVCFVLFCFLASVRLFGTYWLTFPAQLLSHFIPTSDQHLISPHTTTGKSHIEVTGI